VVDLKKFLALTALIGPGISYLSIYMFHILLPFYLIMQFSNKFLRNEIKIKKDIFILIIIAALIAMTTLFHGNVDILLRYCFYLFCGISVSIIFYDLNNLNNHNQFILKLFSTITKFNIILGTLEVLRIIRWPISPFSSYSEYFSTKNLEAVDNYGNLLFFDLPTTFYWNPNNYLFIVILLLPFIQTRKKFIHFVYFIMVVFLILATGSRGGFLGIIFYILFYLGLRRSFVCICVGILGTFVFSGTEYVFTNISRSISTFTAITTGLELMISGEVNFGSSLNTRASLYLIAISKLIDSDFIGLGLGGIEAHLIEIDAPIQSLHFFILQILADLGVFGALIITFIFFIVLKVRSRRAEAGDLNAKIAHSWFVFIPASISPSDLFYFLPLYALLGVTISQYRKHA
jgi:hypothetical protein